MFAAIRRRLWKLVDCRARYRSARGFGYRISAAPFREMGWANFAVSSYTGWPHSLDSEARQFGDVRPARGQAVQHSKQFNRATPDLRMTRSCDRILYRCE